MSTTRGLIRRPTARRRPALLLLVVVALLAGTACSASTSADAPGRAATRAPSYPAGTPLSGRLPADLRNAAFTDQTGATVHLADFAGKTVVLQDSMTLCQELCPIDTSSLVATATDWARTAADPADVVFLTVTIDPQRDTQAQLAAYRRQYVGAAGDLPQWRLLTGSPQTVAALWKYLGVYVQRVPLDEKVRNWRTGQPLTYDVEHSDQVFFLDGSLHERYLLDGMPSLGGRPVPAAMERFMSAAGRRNQTRKQGWTPDQAVGVLTWLTGS